MARTKSTPGGKRTSPLQIPVTPPRNPIATHPLLKKSGAHADRRRRAIIDDAVAQVGEHKSRRHETDAS